MLTYETQSAAMTYFLCVEHISASGRETLCSERADVSLAGFAEIRADAFRWMDGSGIGVRLNSLWPNRVVVTDEHNGVLFSAYRT